MSIRKKRNKKVLQVKRKKKRKKKSFWKSKLSKQLEELSDINEAILLHVEVEDLICARELAEKREKKGLDYIV